MNTTLLSKNAKLLSELGSPLEEIKPINRAKRLKSPSQGCSGVWSEEEEKMQNVAQHEAAHAAMRWLRGMEATELRLFENGGFCYGTGKKVRAEDELLVTLAGVAWDLGCGIGLPQDPADFSWEPGSYSDLDEAAEILSSREHLRLRIDVAAMTIAVNENINSAVAEWIERAGDMLFDYWDLIETLGNLLFERRRLSASAVAAVIREYAKRNEV